MMLQLPFTMFALSFTLQKHADTKQEGRSSISDVDSSQRHFNTQKNKSWELRQAPHAAARCACARAWMIPERLFNCTDSSNLLAAAGTASKAITCGSLVIRPRPRTPLPNSGHTVSQGLATKKQRMPKTSPKLCFRCFMMSPFWPRGPGALLGGHVFDVFVKKTTANETWNPLWSH